MRYEGLNCFDEDGQGALVIDTPPALNKRALLKLGWTAALIEAILGKPDKVEHHKHGLKHWVEHIYTRDRVDAGMRDPKFLDHAAKRKKRAEKVAQTRADFPAKYADWREALPEACEGLFSLNRYAKYERCSPLHKHEIYRLKNELIEVLWRNGYSSAAWIHRVEQPEQRCHECAGDSFCDHCDGSGIYRQARTLEFWCFKFLIQGKPYCWHQPRDTVAFSPSESVPPQDWQGFSTTEKPIKLAPRKFSAAKDLLRWVIDRAQSQEDEAAGVCQAIVSSLVPGSLPF